MEFELKRITKEWNGVQVTVQEADGYIGMKRQMLRGAALKWETDQLKTAAGEPPKQVDQVELTLRLIIYPDYMAALVASEGLPDPLPFEVFRGLPEPLVNAWGAGVYEANPHWLGMPKEEAQKKASSSGSGSTDTSKTRKRHPTAR